jgi:3-deoxy-manno-octulosonate cytidylyltransferase (CMP-KDO synthetase)
MSIIPFTIIIPARYGSTRLPAKMLADIAGKPMILHVYEQALKSGAEQVFVATDDNRIADVLRPFTDSVIMTRSDHLSGTLRIAEALKLKNIPDETLVINVQGDLPLVHPALIRQLAYCLIDHPDADLVTLAEPLNDKTMLKKSQHVKVVLNAHNYALYFSRSPIPWQSNFEQPDDATVALKHVYNHIGLYGYRARYIHQFAALAPSPLESLENLEQLRALWHGHEIYVDMACENCFPGVDTAEDLENIKTYVRNHPDVFH